VALRRKLEKKRGKECGGKKAPNTLTDFETSVFYREFE
jgi:hypothetical protein